MIAFPHAHLKTGLAVHGGVMRMASAWLMLALHAAAQQAPPLLLVQPADSEVLERDSAIFQVVAGGVAPLSYQWRRNGYDIPDQTLHRLILDRTRMSDNAARFDVVVSNSDGVVTSQVAVLTVRRDSARPVVIYYDDVAGPYNYGRLYVNQFRNLLGHFHVDIEPRNVADYQPGDIDAFDAAFYIGSAFNASLPASFLADAAIPGRTLVWINYNIWQLLWSGNDVAHLGLSYEGIVNGYNRVSYKGENLYKGTYDFEAVHIAATGVDQVYAEMFSATNPSLPTRPYAVRSGSFWYFADNCFTDDVDLSRSLVLADLLHEILDTGIVPPQPRALVRIEDINAYYNTAEEVLAIADMLQGRGIRASFGVIPRYISAADCVDSGDCVDIAMSDDPGFQAMLADIVERGHFLLVHGYTHNNVEEGEASGPGYEFWNHAENRPLFTDSWDFAADRVLAGRAEFLAAGLPARIWETPHYEASLVANHAIAAIYTEWYERLRPYNIFSDGLSREDLDAIAAAPPSPEFQTQYLPYTSYQSVYGTKVVPENLNFFSDEWYDSYGNQMNVPNKLMYARHLKVVRDGVASFYFHPYLDISTLEDFLDQMEASGYVFTDAETLLDAMPVGWSPTPAPPVIVASPEDLTVDEGDTAVFTAAVSGSDPLAYQWRRDGLPIAGANGTRLILDPVLGSDRGLIDLVLQNALGSVTSAPALLTVNYPVTYNANGATGGTVPAAQVKTYGVAVTLANNSGNLARTGHTFAGWNTAANGSGTAYATGASYTANASVTLYAQWTADTYPVTYNANGATGGTVPAAQTKTYGVALTLATNSGNLARTGYTFAGWNTTANGSGTAYAAGASYTANASVTLYAQWTIITYPVAYAANGATGGTVPAAQTKTYGVAVTLATNSGNLARTGHTFAGWNTAANGSGTAYAAGASYTANASVTLYAQWTADTYPVTYNANGATGGTVPAAQVKTYGVALTLATNTGNLALTGYTFAGWNTATNGSGTAYAAGASYTANSSVTLFARWIQLTVTPVSRDHTHEVASGQTISVTGNVDWTAAKTAAWITVTGGSTGTGTGTVTYSITANSGAARSDNITVSGGGVTRLFTVNQAGLVADTTLPTVTITAPTSAATWTSPTNLMNIGGTASDNVGVTSVRVRNFRDVGDYTASGTTNWQYSNLPLFQGQNRVTAMARDAAGNSSTGTLTVTYNGDTLYDDVLRSGGVMQEIVFPDNLTPGSAVTVRWKVLSYVPVVSRVYAGVPGAWSFFRNGTYVGFEQSPWNLDGRHAGVYAFECEWLVPQQSGEFKIWFNVAQMDAYQFMIPVIPDGVDARPDPVYAKLIQRTILPGGTGVNPVSDPDTYDSSMRFENVTQCKMRSSATVTAISMPDNLTPGTQATVTWKVHSYVPVNGQLLLLNLDQQQVWESVNATRIGSPAQTTFNFQDRATGIRHYAVEYTYQATLTVPNQPGTQQVFFRSRERGTAGSPWMAATIAAGTDPRPAEYNGMYGRFIERTINP